MKKKNIIFDIDDTLLDYQYSDRYALSKVYKELNKKFDENEYKKFFNFAGQYWDKFENSRQKMDTQGLSRIDYVRSYLYQSYFGIDNIPLELAYELMKIYINNLGVENLLFDDVPAVLDYLYSKYILYIASNGPEESQIRKLRNTGILNYFKGIVSSDSARYAKPKREYYEYLFKQYSINPHESVVVGDSLTSDIAGANQNDMYSIWYNRNHEVNTTTIKPNEEIKDIKELKRIL